MSKKVNLLISIPAFNEERTLHSVISRIPKKIPYIKKYIVLVIDDGSIDNTYNIALKEKVMIVKHIINLGLGASLGTAFYVAKKLKVDIMVTLDADGQHDSQDIPKLIKPIYKNNADVVVGSRLIGSRKRKKMPLVRYMINYIANIITFLVTGVYSTDSQSGFRAFSKKSIDKIDLISQKMEVSSEVFREIKKYSLKYQEVPIDSIYTQYSLKKGQSVFNAPNVLIKLLLNLARR